ncbi:cell division protein DivIVA [Terrabacter sp. 2RAF25]|uniref:cell division protein DivIVA n=1 Tax=Terrabacter sp. 2RAF25 TaxID=3232998 RepID=UPI003F9CEF4A
MKWFILFVGIIVLCLVVALLLGLAGGGLGRASASLSHEPLPDEPLADTDFDDLVFDVGARGYRMSQVDGVVDRLRRELREKDEQIAVLRGEPAPGVAETATDDGPDPELHPAATPEADPGSEIVASRGTPAEPDGVDEHDDPGVEEGEARTPSAPSVGHERTP